MPKLYVYNTSATQLKKRYAMIGSTATQIKKKYAMIGSTATLVYSAEYNALIEGGWTSKITYSDVTATTSSSKIYIETNGTGYQGRVYKQLDITNYSKLTITYSGYAYYSSFGAGLVKSLPADYNPQGVTVGVSTEGLDLATPNTIASTTKTFNISSLTGNYYLFVGAYQGSSWDGKITVTKFLLE